MGKKSLLSKFLKSNFVKIIRRKSKKIILPGFDEVPIFDVMIFFFKGINNGRLTERGSAIAFNFFLALFPALLFFFTLVPYLPFEQLQVDLMALVSDSLPEAVFNFVEESLDAILNQSHGGLLSLGFALALIFASNGFKGLISGFDSSYHNKQVHNFWYMQYMSIFMLIVFSMIAIITIILMISYKFVLGYFVQIGIINSDWTYFLIAAANWLITILMVFFMISFTYYLGSPKGESFKLISAGSSLATFLYIISFLGFDFYINNFSRYNILYGSIGTIIIILLWIYLVSLILLIGYELNISIRKAKKSGRDFLED
jgi:membrane protein